MGVDELDQASSAISNEVPQDAGAGCKAQSVGLKEHPVYERLAAKAIFPKKFVLAIGNARSGTTIAGAILDSHPNMLCANETSASAVFWRDMNREQIVQNIIDNCRNNIANDRPSEGYSYGIESVDKECSDIIVIGDKIWNPAVLLLAGQRNLLESLRDRIGAEIALVNCVRNPFDVIATMHRRSGASLRDRFGWYAMHCEATQILIDRGEPLFLLRHEELLRHPREISKQLFDWLGYPTSDDHLANIQTRVFPKPHQTRCDVGWSDELKEEIGSSQAALLS